MTEPDGRETIRTLIDRRAEETPGAVYLIDPETGPVTYAELRAAASAFAAWIAAQGVRPGESVAYAMANGAMSARIILGALYGGFRATAINLVAGPDAISYAVAHSEARLVLVEAETVSLITEALEGSPPVVEATDALFVYDGLVPPAPKAEDDGLLMYTSGTTGRPKGVVLTQGALVAGGGNAALAHELSPADRALCVLPLYHINGLSVTLLGTLVAGGSVVLPRRFSVAEFWPLIRENGCNWFSAVPTQISWLLNGKDAGADGIRFGRSASSPLAPDVQRAFEARFGFPIIETMGLTETAGQILSNPLPPGLCKIGSPGLAYGNEVRVNAPLSEEGEVLVRGPNVMKGYFRYEQATLAAFTGDSWFRTGDLGRMDADGYFFITGRLKELIIKGGENIAPREVDEALYAHPDVIEAAAFALPCVDYGQRIEAGVVLREDSSLTEADLIAQCRARIGAFKSPDRVHILTELPKGPSGKIQRIRLADMVA